METVNCNLCGSAASVPVIAGRDRLFHPESVFHVVRCADCALTYLNPRPDARELGGFYPPEYQAGIRAYPESDNRMTQLGVGIWLRRRTPTFVPGGRLLDIGCSAGSYLREMRKLGWEVHGVEMDQETSGIAREQHDLDVRTATAEEGMAEFPDAHFDVVTSWHVLEHVFDPSRFLSEAFRILKPGGRLMLEVPNFACPSRMVLRTYWFPLELPRHLYHYTPRSLGALLTKAGFREHNLRGVPSALAITLSLQLIWNKWTGNRRGLGIVSNPVLLSLFFPVSWLLARFRWSAHMTADAVRPVSEAAVGTHGAALRRTGTA